MILLAEQATKKAKQIVNLYGTKNPDRLARELGIIVMERPFAKQKGMYKVIERNRFIFLKNDLPEPLRSVVLLHEIGHDLLHRKEAIKLGGFQEFNLFDFGEKIMEYEANIFASEIMLADNEILEYIYSGYSVEQIAINMNSDPNLVALKVDSLNRRGFEFRKAEYNSKFLI